MFLKKSLKLLNPQTFVHDLSALCPDFSGMNFLLAVSGGADSMVLMDLARKNQLNFQVAHVNYNLRGSDSVADERLVRQKCVEAGIKLHVKSVSEKDHPNSSVQLWAREIRYSFFREVMEKEKISFLMTAHHLNDELETFLINLSKAAGIRGLSGMPAAENSLLRPLLHFSRQDILNYAAEHQVEFREDASNQQTDYLRNKIRLEVVPALLNLNENFLPNFGASIGHLKEAEDFINQQLAEIAADLIKSTENESFISKEAFFRQSPFVQFELLRRFGFMSKTEIGKMGGAQTGGRFYSATHELTVGRDRLRVRPKSEIRDAPAEEIILEKTENGFRVPSHLFNFPAAEEKCWHFDLQKVSLPLKIRHKKEGDFFFPAGMQGRKTVSKFFKDEKIPTFDRQKIWLLCDGHDAVLGVLPNRQDRSYASSGEAADSVTVFFPAPEFSEKQK